jgi:hypothetical protein
MSEPHRPPAVAKQSSAVATIHDQGIIPFQNYYTF